MVSEKGEDILKKRALEAGLLIKQNSIYFGHNVNLYGTPKEKGLIRVISKQMPRYNLYNPNQKHNQENYRLWKEHAGNGMKYYFDIILPEMEAGIFLAFADGMFGAGVFGEAAYLKKNGKPIWEINTKGLIKKINILSNKRKLSIEDTRARVYGRK